LKVVFKKKKKNFKKSEGEEMLKLKFLLCVFKFQKDIFKKTAKLKKKPSLKISKFWIHLTNFLEEKDITQKIISSEMKLNF